MNRSTKYVKNQELKRFNNIKGKKKYLLTSKVMNRMELSVPIILYLMFIGIVVYLMRYQGNEKIATVIDFIIAVMSVVIMVMSYIRTIITKKENANAIWIYNGIFILILSIGLVVVLIAGIKMNTGSTEDAIYPEFYPKVLGSTIFLTELLKQEITVSRLHKKVSIFEYFENCQIKPWWGKLFNLKKEIIKSNINPTHISKQQQTIVDALFGSFFCSVDKKTDMISVSVTTLDADVSAQIADLIRKRLQIYITQYRTNKSRKDVEYTRKIVAESRAQYIKAQQKYSAYCDANEDIGLMSFTQVRDRLENEMQMAYNMYQQSVQQMQLAQAKLQERTPIFVTIHPAAIPSKPSGPKRIITMALMSFLAFFCSFSFYMVKDIYNQKMGHATNEY